MEDPNLTSAHSSQISSQERSMGMWMHLGALLASFVNFLIPIPFLALIVVLVLYYTQKDKSSFVAENGMESLNFQITLALVGVVLLIVGFVVFGSSILTIIMGGISESDMSTGAGILGLIGSGLLVGFLFFVIGVFSLVVMIMGSVRANAGQVYRYPISFRLVK